MSDRTTKISIVAPKMYPVLTESDEHSFGGAEIALTLIAGAISREDDFDVHVLVGDYGQPAEERLGRLTVHRALNSSAGYLRNAIGLISCLNRVNADIYIQRALALASTAIAVYCRLKGRKFLYWMAHDNEADGGHPLYSNRVTSFLARLMFRSASHVIAQNGYEKEKLEQLVPGVRCSVIKRSVAPQKTISNRPEDIDAIWVGRCDDWKNPEAFIDLARAYGDFRFVMVCPAAEGKDDYYKAVQSLAAECDNLQFLGRTAHRDVIDMVSRSRVFCITSSQEGDWPNVVVEAASLGKPVLSLAINYEGLITPYGGGQFCDGSFSAFTAVFGDLMTDASRRRRMGEQAFRYASEVHDLDTQTRKLTALINELTADISR